MIRAFAWGRVDMVSGRVHKDAMVWYAPNGSEEWDWANDGTRHVPGITQAAVERLLAACPDCTHVILSKGVDEKLRATPEAIRFLVRSGLSWAHLQSEEAVRRYNQWCAEGLRVAMLLHSTC